MNLQGDFLEEITNSKKEVKIILTKGIPIQGIIEGYDRYKIVIKVNGKQQTLYKHAISTIVR